MTLLKAITVALVSVFVLTGSSTAVTISPVNQTKYHLTVKQIHDINIAERWAKGSMSRMIRQRESGGDYRINTGNGYYGAYQFLKSSWLANGGGKFAQYPNKAPRWAQDYIAWKYYKRSGWSPWSTA